MNVGQFVVAFLSDLLVTVFAYGLGPIILLKLHKGPISIKKLKWFHIIYTIIISFSFNVILLLLELRPVSNFTPALIWGTVFYRFNKKKFAQREKAIPPETYTQQEAQMKQFVVDDATGEVISEPPAEEPKPITLEYHPDFRLQGPPEDPKPPVEARREVLCPAVHYPRYPSCRQFCWECGSKLYVCKQIGRNDFHAG